MQTQFKDLKKGDVILYQGAIFELCAPVLHDFENSTVYTIYAKFIERRKINKIVSVFNRRKNIDIYFEKGLNLQGFADDKIELIEQQAYLKYA